MNQELPLKWHPKDFYTDLQWLESDLIIVSASLIERESKKTTHPQTPVKANESDTALYIESIKNYKYQYELALDTNVFISDDRDNLPDEIFINFEDRIIRWINGSLYRCPVIIIPTNDETYEEAIGFAKKFTSLLIFENPYISIKEAGNVGRPVNFYPAMIRQPRLPSITAISSQYINHSSLGKNEKEWLALSFYKEAKNSDSIYYEMFNYYKIIQMVFLNNKGGEDSQSCISWLDSEINTLPDNQDKKDLISDKDNFNKQRHLNLTLGGYINHLFRDSIAHVGKLTKRDKITGVQTVNPDDLDDARRFRKVINVVEQIARKTLEKGMHK